MEEYKYTAYVKRQGKWIKWGECAYNSNRAYMNIEEKLSVFETDLVIVEKGQEEEEFKLNHNIA
jgi:hypothetical protein